MFKNNYNIHKLEKRKIQFNVNLFKNNLFQKNISFRYTKISKIGGVNVKRIFSEFKEFILAGDVLDLAVGVVIGSAFTAIVTQVVEGLITPLIGWFVAAITGTRDLESSLSILDWSPVAGVTFQFGEIVSAVIIFILTGFILFIIVKTANKAKLTQQEEEAPAAEDYLAEIRDLLRQEQGLPIETDEDNSQTDAENSDSETTKE